MTLDEMMLNEQPLSPQGDGGDLESLLSQSSSPVSQNAPSDLETMLGNTNPLDDSFDALSNDINNGMYDLEAKKSGVMQNYEAAKQRIMSKAELDALPTRYISNIDDGDTVKTEDGSSIRLKGLDTFETPHSDMNQQKSVNAMENQKRLAYDALGIDTPTEATVNNELGLVHEAGQREKLKLMHNLTTDGSDSFDPNSKDLDMSYFRNNEMDLGKQHIPVKIQSFGKDKYGRELATIYRADTLVNINDGMKTSYNQPRFSPDGRFLGFKDRVVDPKKDREFRLARQAAVLDTIRHKDGSDETWQNIKYTGLSALDAPLDFVKFLGSEGTDLLDYVIGTTEEERVQRREFWNNTLPKMAIDAISKPDFLRNNFADEYYVGKAMGEFDSAWDEGDYAGAAFSLVKNPSSTAASVLSETIPLMAGGVLAATKKAPKMLGTLYGVAMVAGARQLEAETEYIENFGEDMDVGRRAITFGLNSSSLAAESLIVGTGLSKVAGGLFSKVLPSFGRQLPNKIMADTGFKSIRDIVYRGQFKPFKFGSDVLKSAAFESGQEVYDQNIETWSKTGELLSPDDNYKTAFLAGILGGGMHFGGASIVGGPSVVGKEMKIHSLKKNISSFYSGLSSSEIDNVIISRDAEAEFFGHLYENHIKTANDLKFVQEQVLSSDQATLDFVSSPTEFVSSSESPEAAQAAVDAFSSLASSHASLFADEHTSAPMENHVLGFDQQQANVAKYRIIKSFMEHFNSGSKDDIISLISSSDAVENIGSLYASMNIAHDVLSRDSTSEETTPASAVSSLLKKPSEELSHDEIAFIVNHIEGAVQSYAASSLGGSGMASVDFDVFPSDVSGTLSAIFSLSDGFSAQNAKVASVLKRSQLNAINAHSEAVAMRQMSKKGKAKKKISSSAREKAKKNLNKFTVPTKSGEKSIDPLSEVGSLSVADVVTLVTAKMLDDGITQEEKSALLSHISHVFSPDIHGTPYTIKSESLDSPIDATKHFSDIINHLPVIEMAEETTKDNTDDATQSSNEPTSTESSKPTKADSDSTEHGPSSDSSTSEPNVSTEKTSSTTSTTKETKTDTKEQTKDDSSRTTDRKWKQPEFVGDVVGEDASPTVSFSEAQKLIKEAVGIDITESDLSEDPDGIASILEEIVDLKMLEC